MVLSKPRKEGDDCRCKGDTRILAGKANYTTVAEEASWRQIAVDGLDSVRVYLCIGVACFGQRAITPVYQGLTA